MPGTEAAGHVYPVDGTLSTTLAVDYDALIVPAGERHVATLSGEAHAGVFFAPSPANMPILLLDDAGSLLDLVDIAAPAIDDGASHAVAGRLVTGKAEALNAGLEALNGVMIREAVKASLPETAPYLTGVASCLTRQPCHHPAFRYASLIVTAVAASAVIERCGNRGLALGVWIQRDLLDVLRDRRAAATGIRRRPTRRRQDRS